MSNQIPTGWQELKIEKLSSKVGSGVTPRGGASVYTANGIKFIRSQNVHFSGLKLSDVVYVSQEIHESMSGSQLKELDVLLNITGASIGRCTFVPKDFGEANVNQHVCIIRPNEKVDSVYLSQWLASDFGQNEIMKNQAGGNREGLNFQQIKSMEVILPFVSEQKKISAILTSVDDVIEKTQAQINKLKDLKTGMMQELLTRGVGVDGKPHTEFKDSPVGRIPKGWDVVQISELCTDVVDCVNKTAPVVDYKTPYKMLRTTNIKNGRVDTDNVRCVTKETYHTWTRRMKPESGDLIFTREAPVGECGVLKDAKGVFLGQRTMMYRANKTKTSSGYLMYSLMSEYGQKQLENFSGGSTVPHMRVPDCSKILIKLPSLKEQRIIVDSLNSLDFSRQKKEQKVSKLSSLKKALMQDLLTGKVRVNVE